MNQAQKIKWITTSHIIYLILGILGVLLFLSTGKLISDIMSQQGTLSPQEVLNVRTSSSRLTGVGVVLCLASVFLHAFALHGLRSRESWAWGFSVAMTILSLLVTLTSVVLAIPAVFGLLGLFDESSQRHLRRTSRSYRH